LPHKQVVLLHLHVSYLTKLTVQTYFVFLLIDFKTLKLIKVDVYIQQVLLHVKFSHLTQFLGISKEFHVIQEQTILMWFKTFKLSAPYILH
jgi:AraC-like DNA-binding protein